MPIPRSFVWLVLVAACTRPAARHAENDSTSSALAATPSDRVGADSPSIVGRMLDDVVPDSALLSSWAVYPVERHIGIRLAVIGGRHYLLADTLAGYDGPSALWRIRQAQPVGAPRAGEGYIGSCALTGSDASDGTVVARVTLSAEETLSPVHAAWRLDPATWQFRPFPTDSLVCYNEGSGAP